MNVLITSAARKVWLVEAFRAALRAEGSAKGSGGRVIAADADPLSPALYAADAAVLLPRQDAPGFAERLMQVCRDEGVGLLVPTRDEELPWFAARAADFVAAGVQLLVGGAGPVRICQDKAAFHAFCLAHDLSVAPLIGPDPDEDAFPVFARPRVGQGGRGARRIDGPVELKVARAADPGLIVQPWLNWPEFTLDVATDFDGRVLSVVPRRRVRVEAGESIVSVTVADPTLIEAGARMVTTLGLSGPATVQLFQRGDELAFIEVNPRFGGAAALGFRAGADSPRAYVRLALGRPVTPSLGGFEAGLVMLRHSRDVYVREAALCR